MQQLHIPPTVRCHFRPSVTMRNSLKYIFSFFLILSFFGFGENTSISASNVKNIKETEWNAKANSNTNVSKCYHYNPFNYVKDTNLNLLSWSNEFVIFYNRIVSVKLASQSKIFGTVKIIHLIINKLNIPRRSIECHSISSRHDVRNIMWNYILKRKWINHRIKYLNTLMDLDVF
jgi:hypothetical protein